MDQNVALFAAFGAGLLSFISTSVLPLIPGYLSYVSGVSLGEMWGVAPAGGGTFVAVAAPPHSRQRVQFTIAMLLLFSVAACVHVPPRGRQQYRREQYFASQRELTPAIASAIQTGHVVAGMDREQVWVVVGDPVRKSLFPAAKTEVWLYPSVRFHQDPVHSHGASSFRLVFIDGILRVIEPI